MVRRLACAAFLGLAMAGASIAAEPKPKPQPKPKRQAMPIGDQWNLSGQELEKTKMDGARVVLMTAKGDAKLKRGRNPLAGPWILEASADVIESDFPGKRFIVRGPFSIAQKLPGGAVNEITSVAPETTAELLFRDGTIKTTGPTKVKQKAPPKKPAEKGEGKEKPERDTGATKEGAAAERGKSADSEN